LSRTGDIFTVQSSEGRFDLKLKGQEDVSKQIAQINNAYFDTGAIYKTYKDLFEYRINLSYVLIVLLIIIELFLIFMRRKITAISINKARTAFGLFLILLSLWITFGYLK
jgi:hypothetical protein